MSNYIKLSVNPKTKELREALFIDDYYGKHRYARAFRKDGKDADFDTKLEDCDVYPITPAPGGIKRVDL